ncbi:hypothetical protein TeGR_g9836, partial [Tetraparma gracilis]
YADQVGLDSYSPGGLASCSMCENGSYASATATSCIVCPPFQVGNDDGTGCTSMPGFYADDEGSVLGAPEGVRDDVSGMTATTLDLEKGYWRATESSTEVLPCLTENHCKGGAEPSELCSEGYEGPLCAVCMDDYAATGSGADMQCKECTGSATATVAAGASVFIVVVGLFAFRLFKSKGSVASAIEHEAVSEKLGFVSDMIAKYQPPAKIILSYFQIVCRLSFVYDIRFPKIFTKMANSVSVVVNLDFIAFMPIGCMASTNFHRSLVGYTLGPLVVFAAMLTLFQFTKKSRPEFANRVFSYFLALTFLILPSVSIKIFST